MIDGLSTWQTTFAALPKTLGPEWSTNIATWALARVVAAELQTLTDAVPPTFLFSDSTFASQLATLLPTLDPSSAAMGVANAFEAAILASSLLVEPGSFVGTSTPATLFSVVNTALIDPPSIVAAKAKVLELATALPVDDAEDSAFPVILREAFLLLTGTVTGLNSVPPPAGPNPLVAAALPLV